ncbi:MAG: hypothetical protein GX090_05740 [Firmicutes bacterium]|nr:hypothetical protein [Bacillota bacterium]HOB34417.1 YlmH/Sll1252 family protein [Bacillota bacterium]HPZ89843.1 YlmH/Sll1252 family protein [Bacillota bacterium]HQE01141.1 YlmH/Sll1252 family protein [Bacillota bacterium]
MTSKLTNLPAGMDKQLVAQVMDSCKIAAERQVIRYTDFLDPFHLGYVLPMVSSFFGVGYREDGGYAGAERKRLAIFPDYYRPEDVEVPLAVLEISLSDSSRVLSHRDYLGALTALGLRRSLLGDIIAFAGGAQAIVAGEAADAVLSLQEVNKFKVSVREIPPYQLRVEEQPQRTLTGTVASLRLDAVLSAGLGVGRSKAAALVKEEKIRVNWRKIVQPGFQLDAGDVISIRGRGRLELAEIGPVTRKGRVRITLKKFS